MENSPTRAVADNLLTSSALPAIEVRVAPDFAYLGKLQFVLYGLADVEIFVFVSADADMKLRRLFITQFEGFLDNNSHTYEYPEERTVTLGDHDYILDTFVHPIRDDAAQSDSDFAHTLRLVLQHGYTLPREAISSRFVRLLANRRKEIMFSYMEALDPTGLSVAEISHDSRLTASYTHLADELLTRSQDAFKVVSG